MSQPCSWEGDEQREGFMLAANLPSLIINKAPRWAFYQKKPKLLAIISRSSRTVSKHNLCSPPGHQTVIPACTCVACSLQKSKTTSWASRAGFPSPGLSVLSRVPASTNNPAALRHPLQNWVFLSKIPSPSSINVSLGVAQLRLSQMSTSGWHVPGRDAQLSHERSLDEWLGLCATCLNG